MVFGRIVLLYLNVSPNKHNLTFCYIFKEFCRKKLIMFEQCFTKIGQEQSLEIGESHLFTKWRHFTQNQRFAHMTSKVSKMTRCRTKQSGELFCEMKCKFLTAYDSRLVINSYDLTQSLTLLLLVNTNKDLMNISIKRQVLIHYRNAN